MRLSDFSEFKVFGLNLSAGFNLWHEFLERFCCNVCSMCFPRCPGFTKSEVFYQDPVVECVVHVTTVAQIFNLDGAMNIFLQVAAFVFYLDTL